MKFFLRHLRPTRAVAAIDVETTGLDPATARIVEVAVLRVEPGGRAELYTARVNPGGPIPPAATAVHGIGDPDVRDKPRFPAVAGPLAAALAGADLVVYNAGFDLAVLAAEFARCGPRLKVRGRAVVDPLAVFRAREPRTLTHAAKFYLGTDTQTVHAAAADAATALRVLDAQVGRYGLPAAPPDLAARFSPVDAAGRFAVGPDGAPAFAFGKHRGRAVAAVAAADPGYLRWVLANLPLLDDAAAVLLGALAAPAATAARS